MTRPKVTPLHPDPTTTPVEQPGAFGVRWTAEYQRDTRRWRVVARRNGRYVTSMEVHAAPGIIPPAELARLTAQLLNDVGEDAANLMLADLMEGKPDG